MPARLVLLLAWLGLASCAASLPYSAEFPVDADQLVIETAIRAWRDADLPWSSTCDEQYERIRVVVSQPREFTELCGRRPLHAGGRLYACNTEQYERAFPVWVVDDARVPLLVISELQPADHRRLLVVHETMHWLERCSGKGIDFDHADARVWAGVRVEAQREVAARFRTSPALIASEVGEPRLGRHAVRAKKRIATRYSVVELPPSTGITTPVTYAPARDAR